MANNNYENEDDEEVAGVPSLFIKTKVNGEPIGKPVKLGRVTRFFEKRHTYKEFTDQVKHQQYVDKLTKERGVVTAGYNQKKKKFFAYSIRPKLTEVKVSKVHKKRRKLSM